MHIPRPWHYRDEQIWVDPRGGGGARDLLVDLPEPLASPFGGVVTRIAIPHHMAHGIGARDEPQLIDARSFKIGTRRFDYDQWGLHAHA